MIATLGWRSLQVKDSRLVLMYKIANNMIGLPVNMYLHPAVVPLQRWRYVYVLVPFCQTDLYRHSFLQAAILLWISFR
ncbi:hypothetical protein DPMN_089344 [Dreissena polymorpha]|uniref:Uncharacterized protein n=1 Tax=Dreissena polymorpha TaxID=45954 RepID=A0A9D4KXN2_DREPO|nr:hypothetical protein DPMN_089344 [Dreissena polymorpha]